MVAAEVVLTLGLVLVLFATYEVWGKAAIVNGIQSDLERQLAQQWGDPNQTTSSITSPPAVIPPPGATIGRLYIPRLHRRWVVVQGIAPANIKYAPGHYPESAMPGNVGNFAIAGHRTRAIFWDLDRLQPRDFIIMETSSRYFVYQVSVLKIVKPTAVEEIAPVPGRPGERPRDAFLTLTTCNPKWSNDQRLVVRATLVRSQPRNVQRPVELLES